MSYESLTPDELCYALLQRDEQLRKCELDRDRFRADFQTQADWISEWKRVSEGLERQIAELKQQLAQAQAACAWQEGHGRPEGWLSPDEAKRKDEGYAEMIKLFDGARNEAKRLEARAAAMREALLKWKKYFQSDIPRNADEQEQQGEEFTDVWFDAEQALSTTAGTDLLDRLAKAEELLGFIAGYPGWDIVVIQERARAFLAEQKHP